jgi:hypothetical protein
MPSSSSIPRERSVHPNLAAAALFDSQPARPERLEDLPVGSRGIEGVRDVLDGRPSRTTHLELRQALPARIAGRERRLLPRWAAISDAGEGKPGALLSDVLVPMIKRPGSSAAAVMAVSPVKVRVH